LRTLTVVFALWAGLATAEDAVTQWEMNPEQPVVAGEVDYEAFKWIARPLVVFADSPLDPAFQDQMALLQREVAELVDRDILWITDTDPSQPSALRQKLRPKGFSLVLIGKDGTVKLRKPLPWDVRELSRVIDKMPMRQREIEEDRLSRAGN